MSQKESPHVCCIVAASKHNAKILQPFVPRSGPDFLYGLLRQN